MQIKVSITKSTYDKMRQRRKEEKEPLDIKDCEKKEQNPWEQFKHTGTKKIASESKWDFWCVFFTSNILKPLLRFNWRYMAKTSVEL